MPFLLLSYFSFSQSKLDSFLTPSDTLNKPRRNTVAISEATIASLSLIGLNQLWYADYEKSGLHAINDNNEWLQLAKFGHVFSSYQLGRFGADALNWSGVSKKNQLIYGSTLGFVFLTTIEVLDGYSKEWGFSWGDVAANGIGAGLYIGQELLWDEQRISLKYSFHQTNYASQNPEKLGNGFQEQLLKDYNGQTYLLSVNLKSFFKTLHIEKCMESDYCCIVLQHNNKIHRFTPHNIAQMYLNWLLTTTKSIVKDASNDIVITVPVKFTNNQRILLKQILHNIGYNPIRILNEPTAATIAYTLTERNCKDLTEKVLVVDCGGGTTDFTLLEADYSNMYFEVINTTGNQFLGGEDITDNLAIYILSKIKCDITSNITKRVKTASETCKQNLTYKTSDTIFLENIGDQDYIINVSRNILETINDNWFNCFTNLLLEISNNQDIDKVVLVGGTTRTPKITQIIDKYLSKKIDTTELNPDYTVSIGAAYQGYLLNTNINTNIDVTIVDTISMSLGIKTVGDIMTPIISKNTMIPCSHTETFVTTDSKQTIDIEVYQGERRFVKDNLKLGTFYINRSKIERETIQITFDITSDSILIVTARNMDNNTEMSVTFDNYLTKLESVVNLYTYSDDTDKMDDMELSNLILAKIELSNTVKSRRSITESHNANWKSDDPIKYNQYTDLLQRAEDIIDTYKNYTAEYLTEYKATFEKIWNEINFL